jgi:nucleoside phosphorylase
MDEAASDVYGLLNMGPSFSTSLAALLGVFLATGTSPKPVMRTVSGADDRGELDVHPTDILRLSLAQGVIESLVGLSPARRQGYLDQLDELIAFGSDGADAIELVGAARSYAGKVVMFHQQSFDLTEMQAAARKVGAWIATVKLPALAGRSIQDIETWDDSDDGVAATIGSRLLQGAPVVSAGDDAQLLAGLCLALMQRPDEQTYATATKLIDDALDDSFHKDPCWGTALPDKWVMKSALRATPREATPDPIVAAILEHNALDDEPVAMVGPEAAAAKHKFNPLTWPKDLDPRPAADTQPKAGAKLAPCDVVIFTYTVDEANALAAVMTPGAYAVPPKNWVGGRWHSYTHNWDKFEPHLVHGSSPALQSKDLGVFMRTTLAGKSVLCFKSSLHLARDDKSIPVKDLAKQIADETGAKLFITTGTAGGIGKKIQLGDAVISTATHFDLVKRFKSEPENNRTYTSAFKWRDPKFVDIANKQLLPANVGFLPSSPRNPRVFTDTSSLGQPNIVITTDGFLYDDASNTFHLQGNGCMVEMDDAVIAMALADGPTWLAIRNASDPQVPAGSTPHDASAIYLKYGFYTSLTSVLGCWAAICGGEW